MGKHSAKCHRNRKFDSIEKNLITYLRDTFPDESNDSGHGSDASLLLTDVNSSSCTDSDFDTSDSLDSRWPSCSSLHRVTPALVSPPASLVAFESNLSVSLKDKMHIDALEVKPRIADIDLLGTAEPLAKRWKASDEAPLSQDACFDTSVLPPLFQRPAAAIGHGSVLADVSVCHNNVVKRTSSGDGKDVTIWTSKNDYAFHSAPEQSPPRRDRIAALLSATSHNLARKRSLKKPSLHLSFPSRSKDCKMELSILIQPEEQHRARYMTEGSRGSIKDEKGTSFPTVKLLGCNQPVVLQVFIGSDTGKVLPHLFYQACKVTGKNCMPCVERMIEGTAVIEINMLPENGMAVSCDCIGILKERNVDVEQRLPYFGLARCKKRSTRCRMVFRVNIPLPNGNVETLQIASSQILCTQSPGLPEICKKSLTECPLGGGLELFIVGKNFQKDSKVIFQELSNGNPDCGTGGRRIIWEEMVDPEKEFLHQSHLICCVPPYRDTGIHFPVKTYVSIFSGGKSSEPHTFTYVPSSSAVSKNIDDRNAFQSDVSSSSFECPKNVLPMSSLMSMPRRLSNEICFSSSSELCSSTAASNLSDDCHPSHETSSSATIMPLSSEQQIHVTNSIISASELDSIASECHSQLTFSLSSVNENTCSLSESPSKRVHFGEVTTMSSGFVDELSSGRSPTLSSAATSDSLSLSSGQSSRMLSLSPHLPANGLIQVSQFSSELSSRDQSFDARNNAGHDLDLMSKIDQLATAMTNETKTVSGGAVTLSTDVYHQHGEAMSAAVSSVIPMMSVSKSEESLLPLVTSMNNELSSVSSKCRNYDSTSPYAVNYDMPREVSVASTVADLQLEGNSCSVDVKPRISSLLDNISCSSSCSQFDALCGGSQSSQCLPVSLMTASSSSEFHELSYNAQCCPISMLSPSRFNYCQGVGSDSQTTSGSSAAASNEQSKSTGFVSALGSVKPSDKPDVGPMTLAFSQLSDADLLSMINPSTFDTV